MFGIISRRKNWTYIDFLEGIIHLSDIVQVFLQTLFVSFGIPLVLSGLLIVEHHGVNAGAGLFLEVDAAWLAALVLVIANMIIEFMIVHKEHADGYHRELRTSWSLRLLVQGIGYRIGIGKNWQPRPQSPASRFIAMRHGVTAAVFVLALSGRMHDAIVRVSTTVNAQGVSVSVPLSDGVRNLLTISTLQDVMIWLGGTILTMIAITSAQNLTNHIAVRVIEIKDELKKKKTVQKAQETRTRNRTRTRPVSAELSAADGHGRATGQGYNKRTDARDIVRQHLADNPEDFDLSVRELADKLKVGKTTVSDVRRAIEPAYTNGHVQ